MSVKSHLKKLIRFETVANTPNSEAEFQKCFDYILEELQKTPIKIKKGIKNGKPWLVATTQNTKSPKLMFATHLDVVAGDKKLFHPKEDDGKLYGRGTSDMKFAAAIYLDLIEKLYKKKQAQDLSLGFMFTFDEESGGYDGTKFLLNKEYKPKLGFLPDGGDNWKIEIQSKSFQFIELTATGKTAHGSRPWQGSNAITRLISVLNQIVNLFDKNPSPDQWINTLNIGQISGGDSTNTVANQAKATLDIRYAKETEKSKMLAKIEKICEQNAIKIKIILDEPAHFEDKNNKFIELWKKIANKYHRVEFLNSFGGSDARFFTKHNIPCIVTKPKCGGHHSTNEWIDLNSLEKFSQAIHDFSLEFPA